MTSELLEETRDINQALHRCCQLARRKSLPIETLLLTTGTTFAAAGFGALIKYERNQKATPPGRSSVQQSRDSKHPHCQK